MMLTPELRNTLIVMAEDAKPLSDEDWGSERQVAIENAFLNKAHEIFTEFDSHEQHQFSLKATTVDRINFAMARLLSEEYNPILDDQDTPEGLFLCEKQGIEIFNPYQSSCGRFWADPNETYPEFEGFLNTLKADFIEDEKSTSVSTLKPR